ncbi:MAG: sugar kinase, partial [Pseudomonadota bacterium]
MITGERPEQGEAAFKHRKSVAAIGECMVELAHVGPQSLQMAFGGDTSNTAVYLARLTSGHEIDVHFVTALGDDLYSEAMLAFWQDEGVKTGRIVRLQGRLPGLYTIRTDEFGERSFTYWRGQAAARDLLKEQRDVELEKALFGFDLIYLSGITLSILDPGQREVLLALLDRLRAAGSKIAFDGNFRNAGWPSLAVARDWFRRILERTDIALPTLDDEVQLFGDPDERAVAKRLHSFGVPEVVVKLGPRGCFLSGQHAETFVDTEPVEPVIDSTAAGDSFNAGYLKGRLLDVSAKDA